MELVTDWQQDIKRRTDEARLRESLEPKGAAAWASPRQRGREARQRQTDEQERGIDSIFRAGLVTLLAATLVLFLGSLLWG